MLIFRQGNVNPGLSGQGSREVKSSQWVITIFPDGAWQFVEQGNNARK
jgi:hypothetical protein